VVGERTFFSILSNLGRWILVGAFVLLLLLVTAWYAGGNRFTDRFIQRHTQPWAVFQKPDNSVPLEGLDVKLGGDLVTVCNKGDTEWTHILVQIDQGYLSSLDHLQRGECKQFRVRDFTTESWKRMPPPSDLQVTRVAVLATIGQRGFAQRSLLDQSTGSSR
jgi:hypothetical protein